MPLRVGQTEVPVQTSCDAVGLAAVTFVSLLLVSACTSSTSPNSVSAGASGTISGSVSGTTSGGPVTGTISGSISTNGVMGGTISGAIGATSSTLRHDQSATAVTFSGSASGTHGGGSVTGTFSGTTSNGGAFSGAFSGPINGSTLTYTASGSLTFSGPVTGTVNVTLAGDCPTGGTPPVVPVVPAGTWSYSCSVGVSLNTAAASCQALSSGTTVVSSSGAFSFPFSVACGMCAESGTAAGTIAATGVSGSVMVSLSGPTCSNQKQVPAALTGSCAVGGGSIQNCQGSAPIALTCTWTPP
jgi:hypothetical protein